MGEDLIERGVAAATVAAAFEQSTDILIVTDLELVIRFVSDGSERITGFPRDEVLGRSGLDFVHPDDVGLFAMTAFTTVAQGLATRGATAPTRVLCADGDHLLMDIQGGPFVVDGEPQGFWMVGRRSTRGEVYAEVLQRLLDEQPLAVALENVRALFPAAGERVTVAGVRGAAPDFVVGDRVPAMLDGRDVRPGSPWDRSSRAGERIVCDDLTELDDETRRSAEREGFASVMVMPVPGMDGQTAALVTVWFSTGMPSAATATRAAEPVCDLVEAAIRIRTQFEDLRRTAHSDALTGLANRRAFREAIERLTLDERLAVLYIDLDGFKPVNDTFGHHIGDALLQVVADRLVAAVRPGDTVARLGGDEFALLCPECDRSAAAAIAERVRSLIEEPVPLGAATAHVSTSIGVAFARTDSDDVDDVLRRADAALYEAKRAGRNTARFAE